MDKTYWKIRRFVLDTPYNLRRIKWFFVRGYRGWAPPDVWSIHDHLEDILPGMLRHLAKHHCGCPIEFFDKIRGYDECWKWEQKLQEVAADIHLEHEIEELALEAWSEGHIDIEESVEIQGWANKKKKAALHWLVDNWESLWD